MKSAFSELSQNVFTRKFGGTNVGVGDPYLTGYGFIWFDKLPGALTDYTSQTVAGLGTLSDIKSILSAACTSVTPPGWTISPVEMPGLGGVKWQVPGAIEQANEITLQFIEMNRVPIQSIITSWAKMIRDYRTGVTDISDGDEGDGFTKSSYAGLLYYWTTAPDGKTVEFARAYDGVFPTKEPGDLFSTDIETVGRLDMEIPFSLDYPWSEPWVYEKCQQFANDRMMTAKETVQEYGESY